ncbi:hypothetical protein GCM10022236_02330 [Microlunatus ginsengisoli]|uniref:DNA primase DNAG catalytic core N-terminal domain-containing protein n=2 Tax=Microlunatus ginsengisoli TaxID=363863 RepID=A0ABP6ZDA0_9ACTN
MRDRVVFGIRNTDGDVVGFTGRAAPGDPDVPKWLNTPPPRSSPRASCCSDSPRTATGSPTELYRSGSKE